MKSNPGKFNGCDYDGEFAFQSSTVQGLDLTAGAAHAGGGYTFEADRKPRLGIEYNYASGNHNPADGEVGTFQNLFLTNHKFHGYMDAFAWQNLHNLGTSAKISPWSRSPCNSTTTPSGSRTPMTRGTAPMAPPQCAR